MNTSLRLTLITLTVGGGFTGIAITSQALFSGQVKEPALLVICGVFITLYVYVLIAGLILAHNPRRTKPLIVALALQILLISSPIVSYRFGAGLVMNVGLNLNGAFWWFRFGADWQFVLLQRFPWGIGINLVPIGLLAAIAWSGRRRGG